MKRSKLQKFDTMKLKVGRETNFRDIENYDVPSMIEEIVQAGRILEPLHIEADGSVLKGNRRTLAAQTLLADPKTPQDIAEAVRELDVFVYTELTEKERTELILDHGSQKGLTRVEVVKAVWRLQRMMYSERDIIILLYQQLAKYTGNTRKAYEASTILNAAEREKVLTKWLHGTVGNYILYAGQMGEYVREQFILTDLKLDRNLTDDEKKLVKFATTRTRIGELNSAKGKDRESGGWDPDKKIGKNFFELIEKYEKEDREGKPIGTDKISPTKMVETGDALSSDLKLVFYKCAGQLPEGGQSKIEQLDCEIARLTKINALNSQNVDRIAVDEKFTGAQVQALVQAFISGAPNVYEQRLLTFLTPEAVKEAVTAPVAETVAEAPASPETPVAETPVAEAPASSPEPTPEPTPEPVQHRKQRQRS